MLLDKDAKDSVRGMMRERQARAITELPSPLVYFGFMFNFSTALAGPAFEISEYVTAQSRSALPSGASRVLPSLLALGAGVIFMVGNMVAGIYGFTVDGIYTQVWIVCDGEGVEMSLNRRCTASILILHCLHPNMALPPS